MAVKDMTKRELQSVVRGLEAQQIGSRVVAIEYLKAVIAEMPDPPHSCECSECAERGKWIRDFKMTARNLLAELPAAVSYEAGANKALSNMRTLLNYSDGR